MTDATEPTVVTQADYIERRLNEGGLRLANGSSTMLQDEFASYEAQRRDQVTPALHEGGRFREWKSVDLAQQCLAQAREQLDPEFSQFMTAVAERLATEQSRASTPAVGREALIDRLRCNANTQAALIKHPDTGSVERAAAEDAKSVIEDAILALHPAASGELERIRNVVSMYRGAPFRSADWLAGELMTIFETEAANDFAPPAMEAENARLREAGMMPREGTNSVEALGWAKATAWHRHGIAWKHLEKSSQSDLLIEAAATLSTEQVSQPEEAGR